MKILEIVPYRFLPAMAGGQKSILNYLEYLGLDHEVICVCTKDSDTSLVKNFTCLPFINKSFFPGYPDFNFIKKTLLFLKNNKVDYIIFEHPFLAWLLFFLPAKKYKIIVHTHNIEFLRYKDLKKWWWPFLKVWEKYLFNKVQKIFFISDDDKNKAIQLFNIDENKCTTVTYGVDINHMPNDKNKCSIWLRNLLKITNQKIILFNGLLNYLPNLEALDIIINIILPKLDERKFNYHLVVCGNMLPEKYMNILNHQNISYVGFVNNIDLYFKAADVFINPILKGGGVKTKIIDSIANGLTVISTFSGSIGLNSNCCQNKIVIVNDNDWNSFVDKIIENANKLTITPQSFYEYYYWPNIMNMVNNSLLSIK